MGRQRQWGRKTAFLGALGPAVVLFGLAAAPAGAATTDPSYYVAVGGSGSVGVQPTATDPRGRPTDTGYANDLFDTERAQWPGLRLAQFGCPGTTTTTMLDGGHRCHYAEGSQMADVMDFLHHHESTVLMTVDVGFNNVARCMEHEQIDEACVTQALVVVHDQLARIVSSLRAAGDPHMHIVGVGHYDPYLGDYLKGAQGRAFASASLPVIARLNDAMRSAYDASHVPMADVWAAYDTPSTVDADGPVGIVPRGVASACQFTWMCSAAPEGPNIHPNDAGYRIITRAIDDTLSGR
jgi:hypothetical protein